MVTDGGTGTNTFTRTFAITVTPADQAPTLGVLGNATINENAATQTVNLAGIRSRRLARRRDQAGVDPLGVGGQLFQPDGEMAGAVDARGKRLGGVIGGCAQVSQALLSPGRGAIEILDRVGEALV